MPTAYWSHSLNSFLLKGEEPPVCIPCDRLCSVEHLLTGCVDLIEWRRFCLFVCLFVCFFLKDRVTEDVVT